MIRLAVRTLRHRLGAFIAAFVAMLLGAAIVMACGGLLESGIRLSLPPQELTGADVVVTGDPRYEVPGLDYAVDLPERARLSQNLVGTVAALPGVSSAEGHVFDNLAPDGMVDAISVIAEPVTDVTQLRELIDTELAGVAITLVGDERGLAERPEARLATDVLGSLAGVFGAMALLVSIYGVASMLGLSIQQRQRELALLRAIGSTPGQLRKLILGETLVLALVATVLAIAPGWWLGRFIFDRLIGVGMITDGLTYHLGWIPVVVAIGSTLLAAVGAALIAGNGAAKTRPSQALAAAGLPQAKRLGVGRVLVGLLLLAGGAAMLAVTMTVLSGAYASATGMPAVIILAIGLAVLSPALTRPLAVLLGWPLRLLTGQPGRLAILNIRAGVERTAAVAAPVVVLTSIATGMLYMQQIEQEAVQQDYADSLVADAQVTSTSGVDLGLVTQIEALPGVAAASAHVQSIGFVEQPSDVTLRGEGIGWTLQGVTPNGIDAVLPLPVTDGTLQDLHGPTVALGATQAAELGVMVGDQLTVRMGDGALLDVSVVALLDMNHDTLVLPAEVLAAHTTAGHITSVRVSGDGSISDGQLIADLESLTADDPDVTVAGREDLIVAYSEVQQTLAFATYTIVVTIVVYTAITMINALASSTIARRREFGLQRLIGSTRKQLMRMLTVESVTIALVGVLLGTLAAIATIIPFSIGRANIAYPDLSPLIYVSVVGGAVALALIATLTAAVLVTRRRAVEAAAAP